MDLWQWPAAYCCKHRVANAIRTACGGYIDGVSTALHNWIEFDVSGVLVPVLCHSQASKYHWFSTLERVLSKQRKDLTRKQG